MIGRKEKLALGKLNPTRIIAKSTNRVLRDLRFYRRASPGTVPGSIHVDPEGQPTVIKLLQYDADSLEEATIDSPSEINAAIDPKKINWISIQGLASEKILLELKDIFRLHRLAMEDVVHVHQRAKVDKYDDQIYIVMPMSIDAEGDGFHSEQISIFLCANLLVTFEEWSNPALEPVKERIRKNTGIIRTRKEDYLAYAIVDTAIDSYFPTLEDRSQASEDLELALLDGSPRNVVSRIHAMKQDLLLIRRSIWPMREMILSLQRDFPDRFTQETILYMRDCQDHINQLLDQLDGYREVIANLRELHLSNESQRSNEVMKVLTIFGAIFFPLNFIAAIYGMNFDTQYPANMPELSWAYGYPAAIVLMAGISIGLLIYFRIKGWLGGGDG